MMNTPRIKNLRGVMARKNHYTLSIIRRAMSEVEKDVYELMDVPCPRDTVSGMSSEEFWEVFNRCLCPDLTDFLNREMMNCDTLQDS